MKRTLGIVAAAGLAALVGCGKTKVETIYGEGAVTAEHLAMTHIEIIDETGRHAVTNPRLSGYAISIKLGDDIYDIQVENNTLLWCGRDAEPKGPKQLESEIDIGDNVRFPLYNLITGRDGNKIKQHTPQWIPLDEHRYETALPVCMLSVKKAE